MKKYVDEDNLDSIIKEMQEETSDEILNAINVFKTETWTFTLNDGSTVTK